MGDKRIEKLISASAEELVEIIRNPNKLDYALKESFSPIEENFITETYTWEAYKRDKKLRKKHQKELNRLKRQEKKEQKNQRKNQSKRKYYDF